MVYVFGVVCAADDTHRATPCALEVVCRNDTHAGFLMRLLSLVMLERSVVLHSESLQTLTCVAFALSMAQSPFAFNFAVLVVLLSVSHVHTRSDIDAAVCVSKRVSSIVAALSTGAVAGYIHCRVCLCVEVAHSVTALMGG